MDIYGQRPHQDLPISFFNGIYIYTPLHLYISFLFIESFSEKSEAKGALLSEAPRPASPISTIASSDDLDVTSMESSVKPPVILPMLLASSVAINVMLFLMILRSCKKRDDAGGNGNFSNSIGRFFLRDVFFGKKDGLRKVLLVSLV